MERRDERVREAELRGNGLLAGDGGLTGAFRGPLAGGELGWEVRESLETKERETADWG